MPDETVADNEVEVATPTEEVAQAQEVVQPDVSTTKAFSDRLKESTQKAIDTEYSSLYGAEYGIHTKAEYDKAIAKQTTDNENQQFQEQTGVSTDVFDKRAEDKYNQLRESDPYYQQYKASMATSNQNAALTDLNDGLKDCGIDLNIKDFSAEEIKKIPNVDKVTELVRSGKTLAEAVFLANKKDFFSKQAQAAQQDTIKKIAANGASSPGSLGGVSDNVSGDLWSMSDKDFKAMQEKALRGELTK